MKISIVIIATFLSFALCQAEDSIVLKQQREANIDSVLTKLNAQMSAETLNALKEQNPGSCWADTEKSLIKVVETCKIENKDGSLKELEAAIGQVLIKHTLPLL